YLLRNCNMVFTNLVKKKQIGIIKTETKNGILFIAKLFNEGLIGKSVLELILNNFQKRMELPYLEYYCMILETIDDKKIQKKYAERLLQDVSKFGNDLNIRIQNILKL